MKDDSKSNGKNRLYAALRKTQAALYDSNERIAALEASLKQLQEENQRLSLQPDWSKLKENEDFIEESVLRDEQIKARVISEYLKELATKRGVAVLRSNVGSTPLTPPKKPKSLAEAKKLAEILIKG